MALDAIPTYPSEYDATGTTNNPPGSDSRRQGDDQIRILKANQNRTWANVAGAVTASHDEINTLAGIDTGQTIEPRLDALEADAATLPGGGVTVMAFWQAAAPTGWTQITTQNNAMLRVVSTAGGGSGGSDSPILNNKVTSHTHGWSTTGGSHGHPLNSKAINGSAAFSSADFFANRDSNNDDYMGTGLPGGSNSDLVISTTHSHSGTTNANAGASNWTPKYVDLILASKD